MHATRATARNGRTPAENKEYARIGNRGLTPDQRRANAAAGLAGRRRKIAGRIDPQRLLSPADLDREIDREILDQLARARAAALTGRRHAAEQAAQAEADLAAFDDAG